MSEPRALPDQAARELIERELDVNLLVEAGAGSGKTEHLARRMAAGITAGLLYSGRTCSPPDMPRGLRRGYLSHPDHWAGTFRGGQVLQYALYGLAARELLRAREPRAEVSGGYYFPTVRGRGERVVRPVAGTAPLAPVLRDLFELVRTGAFVHTATEDDCRFCDFGRACGPNPMARAERKLGAPALAAYRRLVAHA